jgi:hypothetical protein
MSVIESHWQLQALSKPRGYSVLADYLTDFEKGRVPKTAATKALAGAFKQIFDGIDPAKALALSAGRGKRKPVPIAKRQKKYGPILAFLEAEMLKDTSRGALTRAIAAASKRFHKVPRRIEQIWKDAEPERDMIKSTSAFLRETEMIREELSPAELKAWGLRDGKAVARLARRRRARRTKRK